MKTYGLIGKNISYSFSAKFFTEKFKRENISAVYKNFDLEEIQEFPNLLSSDKIIAGFNVTIPYKEKIISFLDNLDSVAAEIGAVNTIKIEPDGKLTGYNTDYYRFIESIKPHLQPWHNKALILGTGGASKAIAYGLNKMDIQFSFVSRSPEGGVLSYEDLNEEHFQEFSILINCTPLGTFPETSSFPPVPVQYFTSKHLVFDLIYNPPQTQLMKLASQKNATVLNGSKMLELQALKAWELWTTKQQ